MKLERRANKGVEVREAPADSGFIGILEGYAAVFDSDSVEFDSRKGPWVERIKPGAFARSLTEKPDVVALWSHRSDMPIARTPDLTLTEDERGLRVEIPLVDTGTNRDLLANVRAGIVDAMSFGFEVVKDAWNKAEARAIRTLEDVVLHEVSAVVWPAYPDTTLAARSAEEFLQSEEEPETAPEPETQSVNAPQRDLWSARLGIINKPNPNEGNDHE